MTVNTSPVTPALRVCNTVSRKKNASQLICFYPVRCHLPCRVK